MGCSGKSATCNVSLFEQRGTEPRRVYADGASRQAGRRWVDSVFALLLIHELIRKGWEATGNKKTLVKGFADFCPAVRELVGRAGDDLKMWQLYDMEALPHYVDGRVALIGDAAHPFQPCALISVVRLRAV